MIANKTTPQPSSTAGTVPSSSAGETGEHGTLRPVFRFAPSPNGELHLGHAFSALYTFAAARQAGGRFLLRIEDIDAARTRPAFVDGIFRDLQWLGIKWEEPVRRQSQHLEAYRVAAGRLQEQGLLYPCFATRGDIHSAVMGASKVSGGQWPRDPDGAPLYPGLWRDADPSDVERRLAGNEPHALRLDMAEALRRIEDNGGGLSFIEEGEGPASESGELRTDPRRWGDVVIVRKDVPTSYHLAVVVDDAEQGITHVTRGQDLFHATGVHRLLQELLGLPAPRYRHHRLILDAAGRKLSKSARDTSLRALRDSGVGAADIRRRLGFERS
jgi:glutamyl-Q tRNA(Asp) synthetase